MEEDWGAKGKRTDKREVTINRLILNLCIDKIRSRTEPQHVGLLSGFVIRQENRFSEDCPLDYDLCPSRFILARSRDSFPLICSIVNSSIQRDCQSLAISSCNRCSLFLGAYFFAILRIATRFCSSSSMIRTFPKTMTLRKDVAYASGRIVSLLTTQNETLLFFLWCLFYILFSRSENRLLSSHSSN